MLHDVDVAVDAGALVRLAAARVDAPVARHVAHLFSRDPLVIFDGAVGEIDDATSTEHWENVQSTNWQTLRRKPPPPGQDANDRLARRVPADGGAAHRF